MHYHTKKRERVKMLIYKMNTENFTKIKFDYLTTNKICIPT